MSVSLLVFGLTAAAAAENPNPTRDCGRAQAASPCARLAPHYDEVEVPASSATNPDVQLTPLWLALQLLPSPGVAVGKDGAHLRLSFQVTPVLYSFGIDPRLSPWRSLVAEPIVRHSGSMELVFAPEYVSGPNRFLRRFGYRVGLRSTFGLKQRGDYLSTSLGIGYLRLDGDDSPEYEAGLYFLFGSLGLVAQYAPQLERARWSTTLRLRFF